MAFEMWAFETDRGVRLPFYKIPYTLAQMQAAEDLGLGYRCLWIFDNAVSSSLWTLLPDAAMLEGLRQIVSEARQGGSFGAAIGTMSGVFRFLVGGVATSSRQITASPVSSSWEEDGFWSYNKMSGSISPAAWAQSTVGVTGGYSIGMRPQPRQGMSTTHYSGFRLPRPIIMTSDGYLRALGAQPATNAYGVMFIDYTGLANSTYWTTKGEYLGYDQVFIKTLGEDPETMARFNPRVATSTVGVYILTAEQRRLAINDMWENTAWEAFRSLFVADGSDAIIGSKFYYGLRESVEYADGTSYITLGNVALDNSAGAGKVPVAAREFVTFDFGSITVPSYFGDYRDYTAVDYVMQLPFIGRIELNPNDVVGSTLYLSYVVNITDGSCVCVLKNSLGGNFPDGPGTIFETTGSWGYDIPLKATSMYDMITLAGTTAVKAFTTGVTAGAVAGAAQNAFQATTRYGGLSDAAKDDALDRLRDGGYQATAIQFGGGAATVGSVGASTGRSYDAGSLSPNANAMGDLEAKLVCYHHDDVTGDLTSAAGKPSGATLRVGDASGYLQAAVVYNGGSMADVRRSGEIIALLQQGVYL